LQNSITGTLAFPDTSSPRAALDTILTKVGLPRYGGHNNDVSRKPIDPVRSPILAVIGTWHPNFTAEDGPATNLLRQVSMDVGKLAAKLGWTVIVSSHHQFSDAVTAGVEMSDGMAISLVADNASIIGTASSLKLQTGLSTGSITTMIANSANAVVSIGNTYDGLAATAIAQREGKPVVALGGPTIISPEGSRPVDIPGATSALDAIQYLAKHLDADTKALTEAAQVVGEVCAPTAHI
jgi:hypothetical protein